MIRNLAILAVLILGVIISCKKDNNPTPPPVSNVHLKNGLLVYLPFEGNMADSSGNGNQTIPLNGVQLTWDEHGNANSALNGTGYGDRLQVINNGSIKFDTAFSVSCNFMLRRARREDFISFADNATAKGVTFGIGTGIPGSPNLDWGVADSLASCDGYSPDHITIDSLQFVPQPESWYNVVGTFQRGTLKLYINGKLISTKQAPNSSTHICSSASLIVGGWWAGDLSASMDGKLDEVRMYNRVLNADEIAELSKNFRED